MNVHMWENAATQANLVTLKSRGIHVVDVGTGDLACGYQGKGRMASPEEIFKVVQSVLDSRKGGNKT
jgi:phosphopantothenoylcysteine decarboxylase/phosphopantothenate--cysteine ligase